MKVLYKGRWVEMHSADDVIKEMINRRRRQVLVHSVLYYRMNTNLISDSQWSKWALELEELQDKYPDLAKEVPLAEEFEGFDHSTGSDLPLGNEWAVNKALYLIRICHGMDSAFRYDTREDF